MPKSSVFEWIDGRGWLVLSPGTRGNSDVRAQAIGRAAADGALVVALVNGESAVGDAMLEDMESLGAPSGYIVDLVTEDDATLEERLQEAGIIVVESGSDVRAARSALYGAAAKGIRAAYERGAVVLVEGISALLMGRWVMSEDHALVAGLDWLSNALLVPTRLHLSELVKPVLDLHPRLYAVGLGPGASLVLGPDGEVQIWGDEQIAVTLGREYGMTS